MERTPWLADLFAGDFDRFFTDAAALRADASAPPVWLFMHVPKTAGSSLNAELHAILQPSANLDIDHTDATRTYREKFDGAITNFITHHDIGRERLVTGHLNAAQMERLAASIPRLQCFTMLRNPVERLVSDYRFQRSDMNLARADFIARTPSFGDYVARRHVHNKLAAHLVPRALVEDGDVDACVAYLIEKFAFVGLQEMYPLSVRALTALLGDMRSPRAPRVRVNPDSEENRVVLTKAQEIELRGRNAIDIGIFKAFSTKFRAIAPGLRAHLQKTVPV